MKELTTKKHWESTYKGYGTRSEKNRVLKTRVLKFLEKIIGKRAQNIISDFSRRVLIEEYFKKYLNITSSSKLIEIGCAPGSFLLELHDEFNCVPCGVDYSEEGVLMNQKLFREFDLDPENIVCSDVFSEEYQKQYAEFYDVVISRNFFEHFQDLDKVVRAHLQLLKAGGKLLITVPNLNGLNYVLTKLFNKAQIPQHNLAIMNKRYLTSIFQSFGVSKLACEYYGIFNFYLFGMRKTTACKRLLTLGYGLQIILNALFHLLFGNRRIESRLYSPYLVFVGTKGG